MNGNKNDTSLVAQRLGKLRAMALRLALSLGALFAALLVVEIGVRTLGISAPKRAISEGKRTIPSPDPILRFVNAPGSSFQLTFVSHPDGRVFSVTHNINSLGLRGPETTEAKPPGVIRIACLGDSFTFGFGVNDHETLPAELQRLLNETQDSTSEQRSRFEVLNCAIPAYDTEQEVRLLMTRVLDFRPDLVLLVWYLNDVSKRGGGQSAASAPIEKPPASVLWLAPTQQGPLQTLRTWSQALDVVCSRIYRAAYRKYKPVAMAQLYDEVHPGWRRSMGALLRARDACRKKGIEFAMVMYPHLERTGEQLTSHDPYQIVAAFCRENDIPCLDLESVFDGMDVVSLWVHATDAHPNPRAHTLAGERLATWLHEHELLPD